MLTSDTINRQSDEIPWYIGRPTLNSHLKLIIFTLIKKISLFSLFIGIYKTQKKELEKSLHDENFGPFLLYKQSNIYNILIHSYLIQINLLISEIFLI